jgi:hypothetical protein
MAGTRTIYLKAKFSVTSAPDLLMDFYNSGIKAVSAFFCKSALTGWSSLYRHSLFPVKWELIYKIRIYVTPGMALKNLLLSKWYWNRFSSEYFVFPLTL